MGLLGIEKYISLIGNLNRQLAHCPFLKGVIDERQNEFQLKYLYFFCHSENSNSDLNCSIAALK